MTLAPPPPGSPRAYGGCTCSCHRGSGIRHVAACCRPGPQDPPFVPGSASAATFQCPHCAKKFLGAGSLQDHVRDTHQVDDGAYVPSASLPELMQTLSEIEQKPGWVVTDDMVKRASIEFLSHRGEHPQRITRGGAELWEDYAPAIRAALSMALKGER